jgi:hypothetical protein
VNSWTEFSSCFTHLRTREQARSTPAILSAVLADATNLGARRMAEASADVSERQIVWARLFHIRPETYKAAQTAITDAQSLHSHARLWGSGTTSSSDGQFFRASDRATSRSDSNRHYGSQPGGKFYSHLSDQYSYYSILPIRPSDLIAVQKRQREERKLNVYFPFPENSRTRPQKPSLRRCLVCRDARKAAWSSNI